MIKSLVAVLGKEMGTALSKKDGPENTEVLHTSLLKNKILCTHSTFALKVWNRSLDSLEMTINTTKYFIEFSVEKNG